jgi:myo-inositol-hexaphosphate 3-phosphohydrolase
MSATTRSQTTASSRRLLGAALGLALAVGAAPFLSSANAAPLTTNPAALAETTAPTGAEAADPAIWVNTADATKSLILGADDTKLLTYDLNGAVVSQAGVPQGTTAGAATGVDVRPHVTVGTTAVGDLAAVVGTGLIHFYAIDAAGQLTDKSATPAGIPAPEWPSSGGKFSGVCMYTSPVSAKTYAFVFADSGQMEQFELIDNAGKIDIQMVRGGKTTPWDVSTDASSPLGGCVVDDALKTIYVSETKKGIWKFGAEPGDNTGTLIDTPAPGHLMPATQGLALVETGPEAGYLMASTFDGAAATATDASYNVYDRATGNAFVRQFTVPAGTAGIDNCHESDGIAAAAGNFGPNFPAGLVVCQDKTNRPNSGGSKDDPNNFKLARLDQAVDMTPVLPTTTTVPQVTPTTAVQTPNRTGYWMVGTDGKVYAFGDAKTFGDASLSPGASAVDLEPTPSGNGYWIVDDQGHIYAKGDAKISGGDVDRSLLSTTEIITSISSTKTGNGYWVFTNLGRVLPFGDAVSYGDMSKTKLNGPVLDSIPTASGKGYYMVGSDGGIFSFGDADYKGSMGGKTLNKPVQSLVPDGDGSGYWLVASDGGIFAFDADFRGSMGGKGLNKPVTGMVRYGNGYLMVAEDGGIFNFSDKDFAGSLGAAPPQKPITSVAVLDLAAPKTL